MKTGRDRGQPIDVDWRRSGVLLTDAQAREYFKDFDPTKEIAIANVKHFDEFYVARIPIDEVDSVVMNRYRIIKQVPISHAGIRFKMKPGRKIRLVPQVKGSKSPALQYESLGFGIYALGAKGKTFGLENSRNQDLVSSYLFFTPEELLERYHKDALYEDMYEIKLDVLTNKDVKELLLHVARSATQKKYSEVYGMFFNNCVHRVLSLVEEAKSPLSRAAWNARLRKGTHLAFDPAGGLFREVTDRSGDALPAGLANGFPPVIKDELYRMGVISTFQSLKGWSHVLRDAEMKRLDQRR
jgi:hypothetical protein